MKVKGKNLAEGHPPYYMIVARKPNQKGKKTYTKLVPVSKGLKLINGTTHLDALGHPVVRMSTREHVHVMRHAKF